MTAEAHTHKSHDLTGARREVLELIQEAGQPITAYKVIEALQQKRGKQVMPPTVYRAIDYLRKEGFVHKIASMSAYVTCCDDEHSEASAPAQFLICESCGKAFEIVDNSLPDSLLAYAKALNFTITSQVIELKGTCTDC
jgi:Fur family zinc uptake transcriptional regulator